VSIFHLHETILLHKISLIIWDIARGEEDRLGFNIILKHGQDYTKLFILIYTYRISSWKNLLESTVTETPRRQNKNILITKIAKCESNYPKPKPWAKTRTRPSMMKILAMFFPSCWLLWWTCKQEGRSQDVLKSLLTVLWW